MLGDTLLGDLMSMNCETEQPFRVGLGFSYDEIQARCKAVVREDSLRGSVGPDTGQLPPLSGSYYDQGLGANIVNVDEPRQVVLTRPSGTMILIPHVKRVTKLSLVISKTRKSIQIEVYSCTKIRESLWITSALYPHHHLQRQQPPLQQPRGEAG